MSHTRKQNRAISSASGFTLIEVALALVILGGSLVVLLGLQSSVIDRTIRDETTERALLLTRELLSPLEAGITGTDEMEVEGTFEEVYNKLMANNSKLPYLSEQDRQFSVRYTISPWKIPNVDGDVMRKVTVIVSWGQSSNERTTTNYFIPTP